MTTHQAGYASLALRYAEDTKTGRASRGRSAFRIVRAYPLRGLPICCTLAVILAILD
jgi:hypothetical protein